MSRSKLSLGVAALLLLASTPIRTADQTLIAPGSAWKYNDSGTNLNTTWKNPTYVDTSWPTGNAQLGYGDGDESTVISYGSSTTNRRITYYFRRSFTVADPAAFSALSAALRPRRRSGDLSQRRRSRALEHAGGHYQLHDAGDRRHRRRGRIRVASKRRSIRPCWSPGNNVIAVEIHQQSATSTDVSFDLELRATEARPPLPSVTLVAPANPRHHQHLGGHIQRVGFCAGRPRERDLVCR